MPEVNFDLTKIVQRSFYPAMNSKARDLILFGGAAAGKSYSAAQKIIAKSLKYPNERTVVIRKYSPSLRLTCFSLVSKIIEQNKVPAKILKGDMIIKFPNGSDILFIPIVNTSGEPGERIKSLTDIHTFWYEEPTELSYEEYALTRLRLRGGELKTGYRQRIHTFNPIDKNHWLFTYFFEKDRGDRQKYTYKDNLFIEADYIKELEALKEEDPVSYDVYALGEWGTLSNKIYTNYSVNTFEYNIKDYDAIFCGVDFGFENPSVWLLCGIKEKTITIIDEIYQRKLTNPELIKLIQEKIELYKLGKVEMFADTAEPARIKEISQSGINVKDAKKNVQDGINTVKKYKLVVHPRCVETIKELSGYKRKEDRNGNVLEDPVKFNDHAMDALRYAVLSYILEVRPKPQQQYYFSQGVGAPGVRC